MALHFFLKIVFSKWSIRRLTDWPDSTLARTRFDSDDGKIFGSRAVFNRRLLRSSRAQNFWLTVKISNFDEWFGKDCKKKEGYRAIIDFVFYSKKENTNVNRLHFLFPWLNWIWLIYWKLSLKRLPPENFTVLLALMVIASPVEGLRPWRSARSPIFSFPIPASCTLPVSLSSEIRSSAWASNTSFAFAFVMPVVSAFINFKVTSYLK